MDLYFDQDKLESLEKYREFVTWNVQRLFEESAKYGTLQLSDDYDYWGYDADRLRMQNYVPNNMMDLNLEDIQHSDRSFGMAHFAAIRKMRMEMPEFKPNVLIELGVGEDGALVINSIDMLADSLDKIILIDIDANKIEAAHAVVRQLLEEQGLADSIELVALAQPANEAIRELSFDETDTVLWNAQLFFEHLIARGEPSQLEATWIEISQKMRTTDKLLAGMIWYDAWEEQAGYEDVVPMFRAFGWRMRGASDYGTLSEFADDVTAFAPGFSIAPFHDTHIRIDSLDYRMGAVLSDLPVRVYHNVLAAQRKYPDMVSPMDIIELLETMQRFMINLIEQQTFEVVMSHVLVQKMASSNGYKN